MAEPEDDQWESYPAWNIDQEEIKEFYGEVYDVADTTAEPADLQNVDGTFISASGEAVAVTVPISSGVMRAWFLALLDEDCLALSQLLDKEPKLMMVNISDEFKRLAEKHRKNKPWKQRTALHAGARRGSVHLVVQLIKMFEDIRWCDVVVKEHSTKDLLQTFFKNLLLQKDEEYQLDALAMAVVNGSWEIIQILTKCSVRSTLNPYKIRSRTPAYDHRTEPEDQRGLKRKLSDVIWKAIDCCQDRTKLELKMSYRNSLDSNFLPGLLFTFHFTFSNSVQELAELQQLRSRIFDKIASNDSTQVSLLNFLCDLQDGQGRTAMHVATDEGTLDKFLDLIPHDVRYGEQNFLLHPLDSKGRTPIYRAACTDNSVSLKVLLEEKRINGILIIPRIPPDTWISLMKKTGLDLDELSSRNGFKDFGELAIVSRNNDLRVLLSTAIVFNNQQCVQLLLRNKIFMSSHVDREPVDLELENVRSGWILRASPLQVAALVGDVPTLKELLAVRY